MLYLHNIIVSAFSPLFHVYNNESVVLKLSINFEFKFTVRTLVWHLTVKRTARATANTINLYDYHVQILTF